MSDLDGRVSEYINQDLINSYWEGVSHFKTQDLVLVLDEEREIKPLSIYSRVKLLSGAGIPEFLEQKIRKPAAQVETKIKSSEAAFWLIVFFSDGESVCVTVKAKLSSAGGSA